MTLGNPNRRTTNTNGLNGQLLLLHNNDAPATALQPPLGMLGETGQWRAALVGCYEASTVHAHVIARGCDW